MKELTVLRMNLLGGMNSYVTEYVTDEYLIDMWLEIVPDGCDEEDLQTIAEDEELWAMTCRRFGRITRKDYKNRVDN